MLLRQATINNLNETNDKSKKLNRFRKLKMKLKAIKFLRECRSKSIFPEFIRVSVSINNQQSKKAVFECKKLWLELAIKHNYSRNESINKELYDLMGILKNIVPIFEIWANFKWETDEITNHKFEQKRRQKNLKIERIIQQRNASQFQQNFTNVRQQKQQTLEYIADFFINESSQQFSEEELKLLIKGLSFLMKPDEAPKLDLVIEI
jgi:hypothetical protein